MDTAEIKKYRDQSDDIEINTSTYDLCVKAFRTAKKLLKLNIKLHSNPEAEIDAAQDGNIYLFNHFARFETFIPQYLLHEETGAYCRSVASSEFFNGDSRFTDFLYSVGVIPNRMPGLFAFLAREVLHGRKLVMFPEGGMVKDKRVVDHKGGLSVFSRTANERRKHHRGAAVIALALDAFKTAILSDYSKGRYQRVEEWAQQLGFDDVEKLMEQAIKPTIIVPSHITFYPIRVSDNILHQAARLFGKGMNRRFAEELIIEGNLLFKHTDMDIRFSKPLVMRKYWRWWEKLLLPNAVHRFQTLEELFELQTGKGKLGGRLHSMGLQAKSSQVRDDYMASMYQAVTINLSHIAARLIHSLYENGTTRIRCAKFHKMLYLAIKKLQKTNHFLHRSLLEPKEYGVIINQGSSRLAQFLKTSETLNLIHVEGSHYVINEKLESEFMIDEIRTENLISVYANEIAPLESVTTIIDSCIEEAGHATPQQLARYRFDDQLLAYQFDKKQFSKTRHAEINDQQTATEDPNWYFLESSQANASAVLLIHGFLAGPAEMRSLGDRLHQQGHHVIGIRLKGHATSPWDLRSRNWREWHDSVTRGFEILKAFSSVIHIVGFSTGGLLALLQASENQSSKIKSVTSVSAPVEFHNKNLKFVPLLHHANKLVSWVASEGLVPFRPNETENPTINYQHIPVRALYQLQLLVAHIRKTKLTIKPRVFLFQGDKDPVVVPKSMDMLAANISSDQIESKLISAESHGVVYRNLDTIQEKICENLDKSLYI